MKERRSNWHMNEKVITAIAIATILNLVSNYWNTSFLLKNLDTTPPLHERVTKNERDIIEGEKDRLEIKEAFIKSAGKGSGQFSAVMIKLEQLSKDISKKLNVIRREANQDRIKAARVESTIKRAEEHLNKPELHEYKRIYDRSGK